MRVNHDSDDDDDTTAIRQPEPVPTDPRTSGWPSRRRHERRGSDLHPRGRNSSTSRSLPMKLFLSLPLMAVAAFTSSSPQHERCCCDALSAPLLTTAPHGRFAALSPSSHRSSWGPLVLRLAMQEPEGRDDARSLQESPDDEEVDDEADNDGTSGQAATRTVNQRLLDELREAAERESSSSALSSTSAGQKKNRASSLTNPFSGMSSGKTDEERQAAIDEAKDLNGINPIVAIAGSAFALAVAAALWTLTNTLAESFATHPVQSDLYAVQRATAVFRNVVMGLFALASGFFGVTGMGIFLLGVRVAVGIAKGELDPTPLPSSSSSSSSGGAGSGSGNDQQADDKAKVLSNAWELMTGGGQGGRRRRGRRNDNGSGDDTTKTNSK